MTRDHDDPARDEAGKLIGGETAHAPGLHQGQDLSSVQGAAATNADDLADHFARAERSGQQSDGGVAPLTSSGASVGDDLLRGPGPSRGGEAGEPG